MENIKKALKSIRSTLGTRKTDAIIASEKQAWALIRENMHDCTVDIAAAEFNIDTRYVLQEVKIPNGKRGNLSPYAGKTCYVFVTTITRGAPRVNFYICEK